MSEETPVIPESSSTVSVSKKTLKRIGLATAVAVGGAGVGYGFYKLKEAGLELEVPDVPDALSS